MATAATFKEWNGTALVPLTLADVGAQLPSRRNLATNPSGSVDAAGYLKVTGTGAAATLTREAGPGADGVAGFIRQTWTTASTNGGGIVAMPTLMPDASVAGDVRTVQAMVRVSVARTVSFGAYTRMATSATSPATGLKVPLAANTWTPITITTLPATAAGDNVYMYCYYDGATHAPGVGETMDLDLVMGEVGSVAGRWFSGNTANTPNYSYAWTGTPGASASTETGAAHPALRVNLALNPSLDANINGLARAIGGGASTIVWNSGPGPDGSAGFARVAYTAAATSYTSGLNGGGVDGGGVPNFAPVSGYTVGDTCTVSAWVRSSVARSVSFGGYYRAGTTALTAASGNPSVAIPANTWVRMTRNIGAVPAGTDNVYFYSYSATNSTFWQAGDTYDIGNLQVEWGPAATDFMDGNTPDTADYIYDWFGTPGASVSTERDARGTALTAIIV